MVAPIADDTTITQWEAMQWVLAQGEHLPGPAHAAVLYYLAANAFYQPNNPEGAEVGQVLYQASKYERIMRGTAIKSRQTLRKALNELQDLAYVHRAERSGRGTHEPLRISVLWDPRWDVIREGLRAGTRGLPTALLDRPAGPVKRAPVVTLRAVEDVAE